MTGLPNRTPHRDRECPLPLILHQHRDAPSPPVPQRIAALFADDPASDVLLCPATAKGRYRLRHSHCIMDP